MHEVSVSSNGSDCPTGPQRVKALLFGYGCDTSLTQGLSLWCRSNQPSPDRYTRQQLVNSNTNNRPCTPCGLVQFVSIRWDLLKYRIRSDSQADLASMACYLPSKVIIHLDTSFVCAKVKANDVAGMLVRLTEWTFNKHSYSSDVIRIWCSQ